MSVIEKFASETPDRVAYRMVPSGAAVTWAELELRSRRCAAALLAAGLREGDGIAVLLENHVRYFEILWAAHRIGLYYTTISRHLKADEVEYIVQDCGARVLFCSAQTLDDLTPGALARKPELAASARPPGAIATAGSPIISNALTVLRARSSPRRADNSDARARCGRN